MNGILDIRPKSGTPSERRMCDVLENLCRQHDLAPWIFTRRVDVDETAIPHSHPVLTLNTENEHDEAMALAELVHEQLHWFEEEHALERDRAIDETTVYYPEVPSARPEGAGDETSTRLHLLVCYLEYQALKLLLGAEAAHRTLLATGRHHYRWIYRAVLADEPVIARIVHTHNLLPPVLRAQVREAGGSPAGRGERP
jgi:hypothetical protein